LSDRCRRPLPVDHLPHAVDAADLPVAVDAVNAVVVAEAPDDDLAAARSFPTRAATAPSSPAGASMARAGAPTCVRASSRRSIEKPVAGRALPKARPMSS